MNIPGEMVEKDMSLKECILTNAHLFEIDLNLAEFITKILPKKLLKSSVSYYNNKWVYNFGDNFEKNGYDFVLTSSCQYLIVSDLIKTIKCLFLYLGEFQKHNFFLRLENETVGKHRETLHEMLPIIKAYNINRNLHAWNSVPGFTENNKDVDWLIKFNDNKIILLEVKTRMYDIIDNFFIDDPDLYTKIPPKTNPEKLFKNIIEKYSSIDPVKRLQGCWINIFLKKEKNEISEYFHNSIDKDRLHFVIINGGNFDSNKAFIIHRDDIDKKDILDRFGLEYTEDLTF